MKIFCTVLFAALFVGCSIVTIPNTIAHRVPNGLPIQDIQRIILLTIEGEEKTIGKNSTSTSQQFMKSLADTFQASSEWSVAAIQPNGIRAATHRDSHYVAVKVHYSKTRWWVKIIDGRNVTYNGYHIHEKALMWVDELENRIRRAFRIYQTIRTLEEEEQKKERN